MNLVLGAARGYNFDELEPFVVSLQRTAFVGDLCLFVEDLTVATLDELHRRGVITVPMPSMHDNLVFSVNCYRHVFYRSFLENHGGRYDDVLLTDVRDVVFQRDPFDFERQGRLAAFLEDARYRIGTCVFNSAWMAAFFGKQAVERFADRPVSCSGTVLGTVEAVRDYVEQMATWILSPDVPTARAGGVDQGVHNWLLWSDRLADVQVFANEVGPVQTLGYMDPTRIRFDGNGQVCNADGAPAHVVHQYDRFPEISEIVRAASLGRR